MLWVEDVPPTLPDVKPIIIAWYTYLNHIMDDKLRKQAIKVAKDMENIVKKNEKN